MAATLAQCLHCNSGLSVDAREPFCCAGCRTVHGLLSGAGLLRYYTLRGTQAEPAADVLQARRDRKWLEPIAAQLLASTSGQQLTLKVQGLRCAACVWLLQELFARFAGARRIVVNPGRGTLELWVDATFPLLAFVTEVEAFGYLIGESSAVDSSASDDLLLRTGVCLALAGSAMMFAAATYFGLHAGPLYKLLHGLNFGCATLAVLIGAPIFMRSAFQAVQRGILHLDLPIAMGIALTYGAALWSFVVGNERAAYYDSLAIFIALMLLGRLIKERIVLQNQRRLLGDAGADKVLVRRVETDRIALVSAPELCAGDVLLVPPGDLVPVLSELCDDSALCSLDWISGESEPVLYAQGSAVPAGAFNAGLTALRLRAQTGFDASPLSELLARTREPAPQAPSRYHWFSGAYVIFVLVAATGGFLYWALTTGDAVRGLEVATAICVVTCPCAIGIATPLAYDLVLAGLRRRGLFVRSQSFLDRALSVRRVVFDKTGTLTTGRLELEDPSCLRRLAPAALDALYTLVAGSVHPKSLAVQRVVETTCARFLPEPGVTETPGAGLETLIAGHRYRLGQRAFVTDTQVPLEEPADLVFGVDGLPLAVLRTRELLRADARAEVRLLGEEGYEVWILSGDEPGRVRKLAAELGVPDVHALGAFGPSAKAHWITDHDRGDLLMVGDGINDSLAVQRAFTSGTPSIDRVFMPWRTDFYFVTPGLGPIGVALRAAKKLARVVRRNQVFAVSYNVAVVSVAMLGLMKPWIAAVLMPLSSIVVLSATSLSLSARSTLWKH